MLCQAFIVCLAIGIACAGNDSGRVFSSAIEKCNYERQWMRFADRPPLQTLEGIVGNGWDNLRNVPMAAVLNTNFSLCRTTPDDLFYITDNIEVLPSKKSKVTMRSKFYATYEGFRSENRDTVNVEAGIDLGVVSISGSYSESNSEIRESLIGERSSMFYASLSYHAYILVTQPGTGFHPSFARHIDLINDALTSNNTLKARYLAEMVVHDYGTHVLDTAEVGALVEKMDFVSNSTTNQSQTTVNEMKAAASFSLLEKFNMSGGTGSYISEGTWSAFEKGKTYSLLTTNGGPDVTRLAKYTSDAKKDVLFMDGIATLDRAGQPLFRFITPEKFPHLSFDNVLTVQDYVRNATIEYYVRNAVGGCTNPNAPNFNWDANYDDGNCNTPYDDYAFGGMYQSCNAVCQEGVYGCPENCCTGYDLPHWQSGAMSCPAGYDSSLLAETGRSFVVVVEVSPDVSVSRHVTVTVQTFWCREQPGRSTTLNGYLFGGLYTAGGPNPVTGSGGCPGYFKAFDVGYGLDLHVCMSRNYDADRKYSVPFGGFATHCGSDDCPANYTKHLGATAISPAGESCDIAYCVRPEYLATRGLRRMAHRPPYTDPRATYQNTTHLLAPMPTINLKFQNGTVWKRLSVNEALYLMQRQILGDLNFVSSAQPKANLLKQWLKYIVEPKDKADVLKKPTSTWLDHKDEWLTSVDGKFKVADDPEFKRYLQ